MSAVERLEAAIAKLEALRNASAPGKWTAVRSEATLNWWVSSSEHGPVVDAGYVGNSDSKIHAELIVSLHRTIDPQLAILRAAAASHHEWRIDSALGAHIDAYAIADAILGSES